MKAIQDILVPTDLGDGSRQALAYAVDLAQKLDARITLVHVFDVPLSYAGMDLAPSELFAPIWKDARDQLERWLAEVRTKIPDARLVVAQGKPWREILATIERERPGLVVMSTEGRHGLGHALLGSVTDKIVRLSPVPVLTWKAGA